MTAEEKQLLLQGMFNGAQMKNVQVIGVVESGGKVVFQEGSREAGASRQVTDEQLAQALAACVGRERVINNKRRWAGVYWYLRWVCNFPVDVQQFCAKVRSLPMQFPEGLECSYESIRKLCTLSFMSYDAAKMDAVHVSRNDQSDFAMCREVALKLGEELEKICPPEG